MRLRLSTQFVVIIVLIEAAMLMLLVWNSVRLINSSHRELLDRSIQQETLLLTNALLPGLAADDRAMLLDTLSLLEKNKDVVYASVYGMDGKLLATIGRQHSGQSDGTHKGEHIGIMTNDVFAIDKDISLAGQHVGTLHVGYSLGAVRRITQNTRVQNTGIAIVALMLLITVTVLVGYYLIRRLKHLEAGARALSQGKLDYRIDITSRDEIADVAHSFNGMAQNLQEMQQALQEKHEALQREAGHLQTLLNGVDAVVFEAEPKTYKFNYVSKEAENLLGYPDKEWQQSNFFFNHVHPDESERLKKIIVGHSRLSSSYTFDIRMRNKENEYQWIRSINSVEPVEGSDESVIRGLLLDISEQKASEDRIVYLAEHDALTGLLNRRRFQEELEKYIALAKRYGHQGSLLFIDLDQFKYINDTLGHQGGDDYLIAVSQRLAKVLREIDVFGRLGGDEFGVILPQATEDEAQKVAAKLLDILSEQTQVTEGLTASISASIGITLFPRDGDLAGDLLAKADAAMYAAKADGRNGYRLYKEEDKQLLLMQDKIHWEDRIRRALKQNLFKLHFQPVINLGTGEITHHEVLLRMQDAASGELIMPGAFIDTAERFGLIREIDAWVLENTIRFLSDENLKDPSIKLAVNLSGRNFGSMELLKKVELWLQEYNADPTNLIFEVTETAAVDNLAIAKDFIISLQAIGCKFALDDFGVGFSSLHYLKHLPIDFIKIDGGFVRGLDSDVSDRIMVKAISDIAKGLGINAIAEFVEKESTVNILCELGVDLGQGYYLGRPKNELLRDKIGPVAKSAERRNVQIIK